MGTAVLLIVLAGFGGITIAISAGLSEGRWLARRVRGLPITRIADAKERTRVRIVGTIVPLTTVASPLTGEPRVWFATRVDGEYDDGPAFKHDERGGAVFAIDDGSGRVIVDPSRAELIVAAAPPVRFWADGRDLTAPRRALAARACPRSVVRATLVVDERALAPGARVAIVGRGVAEADRDGAGRATGYRDLPPSTLVFSGELLLITDRDEATR